MGFIRIIFLLIPFCSFGQYEILGIAKGGSTPVSCAPVTVPAAADPTGLTWTKVYEQRFVKTIDEGFIKYTSNFAVNTSTLTAVSGPSPSVSGGNLQITNSCLYRSATSPNSAWDATEMTIGSMTSAGDSNKLGPTLASLTGYIAGIYEKVTGKIQIIQNDVILASSNITLNTTGLKLWIVLYGNGLALWYKEASGSETLGLTVANSYNFKADATTTTTDYKFGVYCLQSGGTTTHTVSSLRGGASGGVGIFNNRLARKKSDGSYVYVGGKLVMLGDLSPASDASNSYVNVNACVWLLDTSDFSLEIVGRLYFDRASSRLGGQDCKLLLNDDNTWTLTTVPVDLNGTPDSPNGNDYFATLNYDDVFEEHIIEEADLTELGFDASNIYDANIIFIDGLYRVTGSTWGSNVSRLFSGSSLTALTQISSFDDGVPRELGCTIRFNNTWRTMWTTFGDTKEIIKGFTDMSTSLGLLDLPFTTSTYIPGYDWFVKQDGTNSEYYLIGFDTQEYQSKPWSLGRLVVWKANEHSVGCEF